MLSEARLDKTSFESLYFSLIEEHHKEPSTAKPIVQSPGEQFLGIHIIGQGADEIIQGFAVTVSPSTQSGQFGCFKGEIHNLPPIELVTFR